MVNDVGKMVLLALGLILGGVVIVIGILQGDQGAQTVGVAIVGPVIGYMTGNGVLAARGQAPSPAFTPTQDRIDERHEYITDAEAHEIHELLEANKGKSESP